eukprot:TRINITY_DN12677_c0_g1_i1.p1 TRINITY_DN12677_c0_g1~~TRINITY_DN12677_c0_g1_i1.p1  ORF type:complete len:190 (+),score=52.73 TRINITY_DN12677_c0_g1_i1:35-604(+)
MEDSGPQWYFAYGSNMNPQRMIDRKVPFSARYRAVLNNHQLYFNKTSDFDPKERIGFANVEAESGKETEGVLYRVLTMQGILNLDVFEGTPTVYRREKVWVRVFNVPGVNDSAFEELKRSNSPDVKVSGDYIKVFTWIYITEPEEKIMEGKENMIPLESYLYHILQGESMLTPQYFQFLNSFSPKAVRK